MRASLHYLSFLRLRGALVAIHRYAIAWAEGDTHTRHAQKLVGICLLGILCLEIYSLFLFLWSRIRLSTTTTGCFTDFISRFLFVTFCIHGILLDTRGSFTTVTTFSPFLLGSGRRSFSQTGDPYPLALHSRTPHIFSSCCHHHSACCSADKTTSPVQISLSLFFQRDLRPR